MLWISTEIIQLIAGYLQGSKKLYGYSFSVEIQPLSLHEIHVKIHNILLWTHYSNLSGKDFNPGKAERKEKRMCNSKVDGLSYGSDERHWTQKKR